MASQKREKGWCENEWWGIVGLGGGTCGPLKI